MQNKKYYTELIAKGNLEKVIKELIDVTGNSSQSDLNSNIVLLSSRFHRNEARNNNMTISNSDYSLETNRIITSLNQYLSDYEPISKNSDENKETRNYNYKKKVFISYNHRDKEIAIKIKEYLEQRGISVTIDFAVLGAGYDIKEFIEDSIRKNDVTLSLVSTNSLLSTWVALESINSLIVQKLTDKKFIAVYIDNSFFSRNFVDIALDKVDIEISDIKKIVNNRLEQGRNINDLQNELERYSDLKHHLPKIVQRLKETLSVNISDNEFENGMNKIISTIT